MMRRFAPPLPGPPPPPPGRPAAPPRPVAPGRPRRAPPRRAAPPPRPAPALLSLARGGNPHPECTGPGDMRGLVLEPFHATDGPLKNSEPASRLAPAFCNLRWRRVPISLDKNRLQQARPHIAVLEGEHAD